MDSRDLVAEILANWRDLHDVGEAPLPEDLIRAHPECAAALREHFDALGLLQLAFDGTPDEGTSLPDHLGDFRVLQCLGDGGMGRVYLAEVERSTSGLARGDRVALKLIHAHLLSRRGFFKRFLREAELGRRVRHENVVRTIDVDAVRTDTETLHFLVMEYVEGRTLLELLNDLGTVPEALLREIAAQAAAGLAAIHAAGIVHRDLKPENVLITSDHRVRIMDLGIARVSGDALTLTEEGQFVGSLAYAAPEQFGKQETGPAADLYSLGVVLYELATGSNPFQRDEIPQVMAAHLRDVPRRADELREELSPFLTELMATLLSKEPEKRIGSATELADVLEQAERSTWWAERERLVRQVAGRLPRVAVQRQTKLHGRDEDLDDLRTAWESARAGAGCTVLLEGEAGIGKTRLVDAFLRGVASTEVHVLYGSYPPTGGMGGLSDAVLEHFGRAQLSEALSPYLTVTPALIPAFAALVRRDRAPDGAETLEGDALNAVFVHLMRALSAERPLIWVVDDLHFATEDSRKVVLSLARAVSGMPVLLLVTARPGVPEADLAHFSRLENFRRTKLRRLGARDVVELLQEAFGSIGLAEKLGGKIAHKSDGVPFFVFEMIRGLREGQFISQLPDGTWVETRVVEHIEVPPAVRDLVEARLRDVSDERRAILDVGAVHGYEFDTDLVSRVLGRQRVAVLQDLAAIERRSGVIRAAGAAYRFDHHQLQEILYEGMHEALRTEYHALLAEALESRSGAADADPAKLHGVLCVDLCEHFLKGERGERALRYLDAALGHLEATYRNAESIELADAALANRDLVTGEERVTLLLRRVWWTDFLGRRADQRESLDEARALAERDGRPGLRALVDLKLAEYLYAVGRNDESLSVCERALERSREAGEDALERRAIGGLGIALFALGRHDEAGEYLSRHLALSRTSGSERGEAAAAGNLGQLHAIQGRAQKARELFERQLTLSRRMGDRRTEFGALGSLAVLATWDGCLDDATRLGTDLLALAREIGYRAGEARALVNLGGAYGHQGRYAESLAQGERGLALSREIADRRNEAVSHTNLGSLRLCLGDLDRARTHLETSDEHGSPENAASRALTLIELAKAEGGAPIALEAYEAVLARARASDARSPASAHIALGAFLAEQGEVAAARRHFDEGLDVARAQRIPAAVVQASCHLALLPDGDVAAAQAAFDEYEPRLAVAERMESRFLLWKARSDPADLGEAHRLLRHLRDHAPPEYRDTMVENVPLHRDIGAAWEEYEQTGGTTPKASAPGPN